MKSELCLHVAVRAWLGSTPKDSGVRNSVRYDITLPEIHDDYSHLPEMLDEIGGGSRVFDGWAPLSFVEIESWSRTTRMPLSPFEVQALHDMSDAWSRYAGNGDAACPLQSDEVRQSAEQEAYDSWDALFMGEDAI